ncbi:hypothetical protein [Streptomyces sp. CAU 1734]|uniref:hypothetical protein n=1 Tax=Streptomyces sp. CAU 1734 TaxID=3140360 RepID=UPI003260E0BA
MTLTGVRPAPASPAGKPPRPGARRAHPFRGELLRGTAPWAGAAVLLTVSVTMAEKSAGWQGGWGETQALLRTVSVLLAAPIAGAAGCWQGGREWRRRTEELGATSSRGPLARFLAAALPTALWSALACLIAHAAALLACLPYASAGRPSVTAPLSDAVFVMAVTLIGHVAGGVIRWRLAAPFFGGGVYLGSAVVSSLGSGYRFLSPVAVSDSGMAHSLYVWWEPLVTAGWFGGLAVAAVLAVAAARRWTALPALLIAAVCGVTLVKSGDRMWRPDPLPARQVCDTSVRPVICVSQRHPAVLPQVTRALSRLTTRLEGVGHLPERFVDLPGRRGPNDVQLPMLTPLGQSLTRGELTDPERYRWEAAQMLVHRDACDVRDPDRAEQRVQLVDRTVVAWLAPHPSAGFHETALGWAEKRGDTAEAAGIRAEMRSFDRALGRLGAMDPEERRQWLSRYFETARSCDPGKVPAL